jgi:hypothetical protein
VTGRLVLVSSFPKSGNTWTRAVLEQLRRGPDWTFSINALPSGFYGFPRRVLFDTLSPVNAADLFMDEIEDRFPEILRQLVRLDSYVHIMKVHDDARRTKLGEWLYPPDAVHSVIYLVRHPFDVAVSFANHMGISVDDAVGLMQDGEIVSHYDDRLPLELPQHVGSWTGNIASWLGSTPYNVTLARYEDLHTDPVSEFARIATGAGFDFPLAEITRAVAATRFDRLREEESSSGFRERPDTSPSFFRAGRPRAWDGQLGRDLLDRIVRDHGPTMEQLGYGPDGSVAPIPRT